MGYFAPSVTYFSLLHITGIENIAILCSKIHKEDLQWSDKMTIIEQDFPTLPNHYTYRICPIPEDITGALSQNTLLSNLYPVRVGYLQRAYRHYVQRGPLDDFMLLYCVDGNGWYREGSQRWTIEPGQAFVAFQGTVHCYGADKTQPWTVQWVYFNGTQAAHLLQFAGISREQPVFSITERVRAIELFTEMLETLALGYSPPYLVR
jgi:hypothetical protein